MIKVFTAWDADAIIAREAGKVRKEKIFGRITDNCVEDENTGCWLWQGATSGKEKNTRGHGYGRISIEGATMAVHRVMFTIIYGIIPHKKQVDHICGVRNCTNPSHLKLATQSVNMKMIKERKENRTCEH